MGSLPFLRVYITLPLSQHLDWTFRPNLSCPSKLQPYSESRFSAESLPTQSYHLEAPLQQYREDASLLARHYCLPFPLSIQLSSLQLRAYIGVNEYRRRLCRSSHWSLNESRKIHSQMDTKHNLRPQAKEQRYAGNRRVEVGRIESEPLSP